MNAQALRDYFNEAAQRPFVFGDYDCVRFVAEAVRVGWGRDFLPQLQYEGRRSAVRRLRGADGLFQAVSSVLGDPIAVEDLQPGDVAWLPQGRSSIGLVMPGYVAVNGNRCIHRVDPSSVVSGWSTGGN